MLKYLRHAWSHAPHPDIIEHGRAVMCHRAGQRTTVVFAVRLRKQMLETLQDLLLFSSGRSDGIGLQVMDPFGDE